MAFDVFFIVFLILLATFYSLIFEYIAHKYVLHNYKYFKFAFKNHFKNHHGTSRKNEMYDPEYENFISSYFEFISLGLIILLHAPILFVSQVFYFSLLVNIAHYYYIHRKAHIDTAWGKNNIPWHYAHHMGKNQNINWGIRSPIIDRIMGTSRY
tara:strand:+ start:194 stop:655 length:462 start_codon:yes stop_codon:yes gene_type:complete